MVRKPVELRGWPAMRGNRPECRGYRKPDSDYSIFISEGENGLLAYCVGIGSGDYWGQLPENPETLSAALALISSEEAKDTAARKGN